MSQSECGGVCSSVFKLESCHSFSAVDMPYAELRDEVGGDKGMLKFPSIIGAFPEERGQKDSSAGCVAAPV